MDEGRSQGVVVPCCGGCTQAVRASNSVFLSFLLPISFRKPVCPEAVLADDPIFKKRKFKTNPASGRSGKALGDGEEAPFPRGAVDGKIMLKWPGELRWPQSPTHPSIRSLCYQVALAYIFKRLSLPRPATVTYWLDNGGDGVLFCCWKRRTEKRFAQVKTNPTECSTA